MSDPHAPTPAGPDPDEPTQVHPAAGETLPPATPETSDVDLSGAVDTTQESGSATDPGAGTVDPPPAAAAGDDDWLKPDATPSPATPAPDPVIATPSAFTPPGTPEDDAPSAAAQAQEKAQAAQAKVADTASQAQAKVTETAGQAQAKVAETAGQAQAKVQDTAQVAQEKAKAITDRPEAMVGIAFVGGAVVSFLLKRLRR